MAAMETSQLISIESFSHSWLLNLKPSLDSLDNSLRASFDASDEASFIEMDPTLPPSRRFYMNSQEVKFDFPISQSPLDFLHADELFSNGYVMPIFINPLKIEEEYDASDLSPTLPISSHVQTTNGLTFRRCRTLSKHMVRKYLYFLRPLYRRIRGGHRTSVREESTRTSPKISVAYSGDDDWRRSCDSESSIYEAVMHCKRSIGMPK